MASGYIDLGTSNQIQGRIYWEAAPNGTAANTSEVSAYIQVKRTNSYTTTGTWKGALNIGGTTQSFSKYVAVTNSWVTLHDFSVTIAHKADGSGTCYIAGDIRGPSETSQESSRVYDNATVALDKIPRYATAVSAEDFTDEQNPVLTFTNPAGSAIASLQACISSDGSADDIASYRDITKTASSYTFSLTDSERSKLRKAVTGDVSRTIRLYVRSKINSSDGWQLSYTTCKVTVTNCTPEASLSVIDTNQTTINLTGNNQILVRYASNAKATGTATLKKEATIKNQTVSHNGLTASGTNVLTVEAVSHPAFGYAISDSRGLYKGAGLTKSGTQWVQYVKPTCSIGNNAPIVDGTNATYTLTVTGQCFNGSFGKTANTLAVEYRYKVVGDSDGSWATIPASSITWDASTNRYTATVEVAGLNYESAYIFEARAGDKLDTTDVAFRNVKATPVFDWSKDDFNLNVNLNMRNQTVLRHNGDNNNIVLSSSEAQDGVFVRPNGTGSNEAQTVFYKTGVVGIPPQLSMSTGSGAEYEPVLYRDPESKDVYIGSPGSAYGIALAPNGIGDVTGMAVLYNTGSFEAESIVALDSLKVGSARVGVNKQLWPSSGSGSWYMTGSQQIDLSSTNYVNKALNGIVLVFSQYSDGAAVNSNFNSFFVPKAVVTAHSGSSHSFTMCNANFGAVCCKALYIGNSQIKGTDLNSQSGTGTSGIKYNNAAFVLRYVFAV